MSGWSFLAFPCSSHQNICVRLVFPCFSLLITSKCLCQVGLSLLFLAHHIKISVSGWSFLAFPCSSHQNICVRLVFPCFSLLITSKYLCQVGLSLLFLAHHIKISVSGWSFLAFPCSSHQNVCVRLVFPCFSLLITSKCLCQVGLSLLFLAHHIKMQK